MKLEYNCNRDKTNLRMRVFIAMTYFGSISEKVLGLNIFLPNVRCATLVAYTPSGPSGNFGN